MSKIRATLLMVAGLVPLWSVAEIEIFVAEYAQYMVQTGPNTLVPFGDHTNSEFGENFEFFGSIITGDVITGGTLAGPFGSKALQLDEDGEEYIYNPGFASQQEMVAAVPAGTYTFSGTSNTAGAFSQDITLPQYSPLTPLKVTNFSELQSIDISQPLTIEWEAFTEGLGSGPSGGYAGLIDVEITAYNEFGSFSVWSSEPPEGAFGLLPTQTSVTIPANTFTPDNFYILNVFFARIDTGVDSTSPEGALVATLSSYEVELNIYPEGNAPDPTWADYPVSPLGWADTTPWMAYLNVAQAPWIWSASLNGWVYIEEGFVTQSGGWVFIPKP